MKRLFIGGLGHTVSEKDLKDRFGKFGDVSDVEIMTRKDEHGAPLKTFGYVNINITDTEYKRCTNVLNKSTWKGGTLLIQLAKESFLHRLAEERQQIAEKAKTPTINPQEKLVESLKEAGIDNFHMKAAVPGTEIPGHKDWVVSKFGRVLPVLNLKSKEKNKIFKYDPSKYCHNIKRLEAADEHTSVTKLTWEVSGGDDEISKKRRGEFPKQKPCLKRSKVDASSFLSSFTQSNGIKTASAIENKNATVVRESGLSAEVQRRPVVKKSICVFDSDADSEEEIRMLVAQEHLAKPKQASIDEDDDNLEVVGDDFDVKPSVVWVNAEQDGVKNLLTSSKDDEDYDSADTDEILTQRKTLSGMGKPHEVKPAPAGQESPTESIKNKGNANAKPVRSSSESDSGSDEASQDESVDSDYEAMMGNCYRLEISLADLEKLAKNANATSDDENEVAPKEEPNTPSVSPKKRGNNPEDILAALLGDDTPEKKSKKKKNQVTSLPAFIGTKDLFGGSTPGQSEPILKRAGQSLDGDSTVGPKRLKQDLKLTKQSISGDKSQQKSSNRPHQKGLSTSTIVQLPQSANKVEDKTSSSDSSSEDDSSSEESECIEEDGGEDSQDNADVFTLKMASATQTLGTDSVHETDPTLTKPLPKFDHPVRSTVEESSSDDDDDERTKKKTVGASNSNTQVNKEPKMTKPSRSSSSGSSSEESETSDEDVMENTRTQLKVSKSADSKKVESHPTVHYSMVSDVQKQLQDNQKRLAALEQRQKETEQQKKLIQGALSNVDTVNTNRSKHIVFDSDEENDETSNKPTATATQKKILFEEDSSDESSTKEVSQEKENKKSGGSKLFDSSDDDEDDGEEDDRFQIKPQFQGKAGQKLMQMQARFGTDSRFNMDSRFLQSDDEKEDEDGTAPVKDAEDEIVEEKMKNLEILQSVLNTSIQPKDIRKESAKSKTFKDVSALHYDPTREEHTAFETKTEQPKKESKAARRKKREEAVKLPEVSKEIYFDVSMNLKEVFGATKEKEDEKETVSWDKETEDKMTQDDTPMDLSFTSNVENLEDTSGVFKFSFFGEDAVTETSAKTDEYKIEMLKEAKFSWQVDPRFQDSSSDEEGVDEVEEDQSASSKTTEEPTTSKKNFFFFFQDDERLKQGPGMFYRCAKLDDQREAWEENRISLREECRKKHKDARRRQRPSLKT